MEKIRNFVQEPNENKDRNIRETALTTECNVIQSRSSNGRKYYDYIYDTPKIPKPEPLSN